MSNPKCLTENHNYSLFLLSLKSQKKCFSIFNLYSRCNTLLNIINSILTPAVATDKMYVDQNCRYKAASSRNEITAVLIIKAHRCARVFEPARSLYGCSACSKSISSFLTPSELFIAWTTSKTAWNINIMCCMVKVNQLETSDTAICILRLKWPIQNTNLKYWGRASWAAATGGDLWWPF